MVRCFYCNREPTELSSYLHPTSSGLYGLTVDEYVAKYDGTYNRAINKFCCPVCWVELGRPTWIRRFTNWKAGTPLTEDQQWTTVRM